MRRDWAIAAVTTAVLTTGAIGLGYYAGSRDAAPAPITVEVPEWAEPSAEKERNAPEHETDPVTGLPICSSVLPVYPCMDTVAMAYLDYWGDEAIVIADHYKGDDWQGVGLFDCDPMGQDCWFIHPDEVPGLYSNDPHAYPTTTT